MLPSLVVFDLDFTLWDCGGLWVDCTRPPFRTLEDGLIVDSIGRWMSLYPDVIEILDEIEAIGIPMALASRTEKPDWARDLLSRFGIRKRFAFEEIYPSSKVRHFNAIALKADISLSEMIFFDDEERNIREVSELGVFAVHARAGMNFDLWNHAAGVFKSLNRANKI